MKALKQFHMLLQSDVLQQRKSRRLHAKANFREVLPSQPEATHQRVAPEAQGKALWPEAATAPACAMGSAAAHNHLQHAGEHTVAVLADQVTCRYVIMEIYWRSSVLDVAECAICWEAKWLVSAKLDLQVMGLTKIELNAVSAACNVDSSLLESWLSAHACEPLHEDEFMPIALPSTALTHMHEWIAETAAITPTPLSPTPPRAVSLQMSQALLEIYDIPIEGLYI